MRVMRLGLVKTENLYFCTSVIKVRNCPPVLHRLTRSLLHCNTLACMYALPFGLTLTLN